MRVTLDEQEIIKAISIYMALRGLRTGENFRFAKNGNSYSVSFNTLSASFDLEKLVEFAKKD